MRPLLITLMQLCNHWETWLALDEFGRMQEFRYLTDKERAKHVMSMLSPYLGEELEPPTTPDTEDEGMHSG